MSEDPSQRQSRPSRRLISDYVPAPPPAKVVKASSPKPEPTEEDFEAAMMRANQPISARSRAIYEAQQAARKEYAERQKRVAEKVIDVASREIKVEEDDQAPVMYDLSAPYKLLNWLKNQESLEDGDIIIESAQDARVIKTALAQLHGQKEIDTDEDFSFGKRVMPKRVTIHGKLEISKIFEVANRALSDYAAQVSALEISVLRAQSPSPMPRTPTAPTEDSERSWQDFANCLGIDPDLFFPERGASTREAKAVCKACVVREECLESALEEGIKFGIWGGMSERERRRIRRQRKVASRMTAITRELVVAD